MKNNSDFFKFFWDFIVIFLFTYGSEAIWDPKSIYKIKYGLMVPIVTETYNKCSFNNRHMLYQRKKITIINTRLIKHWLEK